MPKRKSINEMVFLVLSNNQKIKFTARQLAEEIWKTYKEELSEKRSNKKFSNDDEFIVQLQAEIGAQKKAIKSRKNIIIEEQTRPKIYFYDPDYNIEDEELIKITKPEKSNLSENELYSLLSEFLLVDKDILTKRIDEKTSKNNKGPNGNKWLHPDLVGIEILDRNLAPEVKQCFSSSGTNRINIYSFEVKRIITPVSLREYFFQAVSNSSWANYGYFVAAEMKGDIYEELKMLCSLHGIGFILIDVENPSESQILIQSSYRAQVDWRSVDRLLSQNSDFKKFVKAIKVYYTSNEINDADWYSIKE